MNIIKTCLLLICLLSSISQAAPLSLQEKDFLVGIINTYKYKTGQQKQEDLADYYTSIASMLKSGQINYNYDFTQDFIDFICKLYPDNCSKIFAGETIENLNLRNDLLKNFYESDLVKSKSENFAQQIMPPYLKNKFELQDKKIIACDKLINNINSGKLQIQDITIKPFIAKVQSISKQNLQDTNNKALNDYIRHDEELNSFIENLLDKEPH